VEPPKKSVIVVDSFYTVSGRIFSALQCFKEWLEIGVILLSEEGEKWQIIDNSVILSGVKNQEMLKEKEKDSIFLFELEPIGHNFRPITGTILQIVEN
jgi:hypothetical protein